MRNSEQSGWRGSNPRQPLWESGTLRADRTEACSAGVAKAAHCARCGKPIEDAADEFCTPCWAAQATPTPDDLPLVHPDNAWDVPLTFVVAVAALVLTVFVLAAWALGGAR